MTASHEKALQPQRAKEMRRVGEKRWSEGKVESNRVAGLICVSIRGVNL